MLKYNQSKLLIKIMNLTTKITKNSKQLIKLNYFLTTKNPELKYTLCN